MANSKLGKPAPTTLDEINFRDPEIQKCPFGAYAFLREEAPVWRDPDGQYQVTRYDMLREVLRDQEHFTNNRATSAAHPDQARVARLHQIFVEKGWAPAPAIRQMDDPEHRYMRALLQRALSPDKIAAAEVVVRDLSHSLLDRIAADCGGDWVEAFAGPLPLTLILRQSGIPLEDMWRIKRWTEAWVRHHLSFMQNEEEDRASVELEIERQHYFQPIFERLRAEPDGSMLSDIVNAVIPEWGHGLSEEQLHAFVGHDLLIGGFETTTNALSAGMKLLIENPDVWRRLRADPEGEVKTFVEEVLRLESPAQALYRLCKAPVELGGVEIPPGSPVAMRFGAANRDERQFADPDTLDLDRANAATHLTFGMGLHACAGAPLARMELRTAFTAVAQRFETIAYAPGEDGTDYAPNKSLRSLNRLAIVVEPVAK